MGGASGPLYGTFFMRMGAALGSDADTAAIGKALRAGADGVKARGKANPVSYTHLTLPTTF